MAPKSEQFRTALSVLWGNGLTWLRGERVEGEGCLDLLLQREHSGLQEYFMYDNNKCTLHTYDTYPYRES